MQLHGGGAQRQREEAAVDPIRRHHPAGIAKSGLGLAGAGLALQEDDRASAIRQRHLIDLGLGGTRREAELIAEGPERDIGR
ncbi:MAG: hypothetical protein R3F54_30650 [Alphaproteobacteria bacterium]